MRRLILSGALTLAALAPTGALAAGFAKDPLFLSKTPVTEGQTVHVYAVISNTDPAAFVGTLVFYDNNVKIGSRAVNLAAGATETASTLWTPAAGTHPLSAKLIAKDGTIAEEIRQDFTINAKPQAVTTTSNAPAFAQTAASIDSSAAIQKDIANVSPQVASAAQPVFSTIDGARNSIANVLDSQITGTRQKVASTPKPGIVAGVATQDVQVQNPTTGFWYWLYTIYLWLLLGIRWLVGNAGVFYPVLAIAFLYVIYRMYRRFRRPAWQR